MDIDSIQSFDLDDLSITPSLNENDYTETNLNNKVNRCMITIFPPNTDEKYLTPEFYYDDTSLINNWCGQFEICPSTDKLHIHIYVEFNNSQRPRFNPLKDLFENKTGTHPNIKIPNRSSNKQRDCAVNYVLKPDGIAPNTTPFIWSKNNNKCVYNPFLMKKKAKKDTKEDIINYIESKPTHWSWDQIVHESLTSKVLLATCSWGHKYHTGRYAQTPRRTISDVIVFYGAGGTGKTTMAFNFSIKENETSQERYYKRNPDDGKFWGGGRTQYKGQRVIHLEEFSGQETAANFKELCDVGKHGPSVNVKNSGTELNHEIVIITSNTHPAGWYENLCDRDPKQWNPICRRFTQVFFFPEKLPDGSLNTPSINQPPFYEDHTDLFKSMCSDFVQAKSHASQNWPLPNSTQEPNKRMRLDDNFYTYCRTGFN